MIKYKPKKQDRYRYIPDDSGISYQSSKPRSRPFAEGLEDMVSGRLSPPDKQGMVYNVEHDFLPC